MLQLLTKCFVTIHVYHILHSVSYKLFIKIKNYKCTIFLKNYNNIIKHLFRALLVHQQGAQNCRKQLLNVFVSCTRQNYRKFRNVYYIYVCTRIYMLQTELGTENYTILNKKIYKLFKSYKILDHLQLLRVQKRINCVNMRN